MMHIILTNQLDWEKIFKATVETLSLTGLTLLFVVIFGIALGIILAQTDAHGLFPNKIAYNILSFIVNIFRSVPTMLLLVLLIPLTIIIVGKMSGVIGAVPTLVIGTTPFLARLIQTAMQEVDAGVVEAAKAMGMNNKQIIYKVLIPESMPTIVSALTTTTIAIIGATTIAGMTGAGGLGNLAYYTGFTRNQPLLTLTATAIIVCIVLLVQFIGESIAKYLDKR